MEIASTAADRTTIETQKRFRIFGPSSVLMPCCLLEPFVLGCSFFKSNQVSGRVMNSSKPTKGYRCNSLNVKMKETGAPEETRTPNP
jgi:hypothetical protein